MLRTQSTFGAAGGITMSGGAPAFGGPAFGAQSTFGAAGGVTMSGGAPAFGGPALGAGAPAFGTGAPAFAQAPAFGGGGGGGTISGDCGCGRRSFDCGGGPTCRPCGQPLNSQQQFSNPAFSSGASTKAFGRPQPARAGAAAAAKPFACADDRCCGRTFATQKGLDDHARATWHKQPQAQQQSAQHVQAPGWPPTAAQQPARQVGLTPVPQVQTFNANSATRQFQFQFGKQPAQHVQAPGFQAPGWPAAAQKPPAFSTTATQAPAPKPQPFMGVKPPQPVALPVTPPKAPPPFGIPATQVVPTLNYARTHIPLPQAAPAAVAREPFPLLFCNKEGVAGSCESQPRCGGFTLGQVPAGVSVSCSVCKQEQKAGALTVGCEDGVHVCAACSPPHVAGRAKGGGLASGRLAAAHAPGHVLRWSRTSLLREARYCDGCRGRGHGNVGSPPSSPLSGLAPQKLTLGIARTASSVSDLEEQFEEQETKVMNAQEWMLTCGTCQEYRLQGLASNGFDTHGFDICMPCGLAA